MNLNFFRSPLKETIGGILDDLGYGWTSVHTLHSVVTHDYGMLDPCNTYCLFITLADGQKWEVPYNFHYYHNYGLEGVRRYFQ